jgi:hypothetical protein
MGAASSGDPHRETSSRSRVAAASAARLLIHAEDDVGERDRRLASPLRRLRALYADGPWHDERAPLGLQVDDLQGHQVLEIDDAGPLVDVPLPAGTYHVNVHLGKVRRGYTMTLEQGTAFDLYLRLAPDPL